MHFDAGYTAQHEPKFYNDSKAYTGKLGDVVSLYFTCDFPAAVATAAELRARGGGERLHWMTLSRLVSLYLAYPAQVGLTCPAAGAVAAFRAAAKRGDI